MSDIFSYEYTPLDAGEIRLLVLEPRENSSKPGEFIFGSLETVPLETSGPFEALSYCWGSLSFKCIQVDRWLMRVSDNLSDALAHLQRPRETRVLWIDAICINQLDLEERSRQVALMADIYATAWRVVVWLGSGDERLVKIGMETLDHFVCARPDRSSMAEVALEPGGCSFGRCHREWFGRFWTVRETALAQGVVMYCGHHQVTWPNKVRTVLRFMRAIKTAAVCPHWKEMEKAGVDMSQLRGRLQSQLESGPDAYAWTNRPRRADLLDSVYRVCHRGATDPRDRIFACLGMVELLEEEMIIPDYLKSVEEVYDEFAVKVEWRTEVMCTVLERHASPKGRWPVHTQNPRQERKHTQVAQFRNLNAQSQELDSFLERIDAHVRADICDKNPDGAVRWLEHAAMLLRGEEHHNMR